MFTAPRSASACTAGKGPLASAGLVGLVLLCLIARLPAAAADLYIDPSRHRGCPGTGSMTSPYCGWDEVREFSGGNRYLQKRGTVYRRMVTLRRLSASRSQPVYLGAYGTGENPTIRIEHELPHWDDPARWKPLPRNIWSYSTAGFVIGNPQVLFLDGRRAFGGATSQTDLCRKKGPQLVEWFHAKDSLYVCSPSGNPAQQFRSVSGMQVASGADWAAIMIKQAHGVVIDGFDLEGGWYGAIHITHGASDIEIANSRIGKDSSNGIYVLATDATVTSIDTHDNLFDSGIRWGAAGYMPALPGEGISFVSGVHDSKIRHNTFIAWPHAGVSLVSNTPNAAGTLGNIVQDNEFHCGPDSSYFDYCRPFAVDGQKIGSTSNNVFFRNILHDFSVRSQINGDHNSVIGNICYNAVNSSATQHATGQCFSLQPYAVSRDNLIANNTVYNTADTGLEFISGNAGISSGHQVLNNIFYNCAPMALNGRRGVCIYLEDHASVGPQAIRNNLLFNDRTAALVSYRKAHSKRVVDLPELASDELDGNFSADPKLRNPAGGDFSPNPDSPVLARGLHPESKEARYSAEGVDLGAMAVLPSHAIELNRGH